MFISYADLAWLVPALIVTTARKLDALRLGFIVAFVICSVGGPVIASVVSFAVWVVDQRRIKRRRLMEKRRDAATSPVEHARSS